MKAAILREFGKPLSLEDITIDKPRAHEVLVRTVAVGVCHSDLSMSEGFIPIPLPTVLGHEAAGIVEQVGSEVRHVKVGDHIVTCLSVFCGYCHHCVSGHMARCDNREPTVRKADDTQRLNAVRGPMHQFSNLSAFAEQMLIHEHACVAIRKDMPLDRAALIGCAVTTGAGAVINTAGLRVGETIAILGCGGVGLAAVNGAKIAGAGRIIAIDLVDAKLELARKFGATDVINASKGDVVEQVIELTRGGVDHAIEAIGAKRTAEQAFAMLCRGGAATVAGMMPYGVKVEIDGFGLLSERRIQGSRMGSNRFPVEIPRYVDFYMRGQLDLDNLVARRIRLDQIGEAFDELRTGAAARSVIMFES